MAYIHQKPQRLFFDIETQANPENCALMPDPVITAPANYKDPVKIAEYIEVETAKRKAEAIDRAALDPDYGKILSIGMSIGLDGPIVVMAVGDHIERSEQLPSGEMTTVVETWTEDDLLVTFWHNFANTRGACVGYNILSFDLPYLMRRSMALGIRIPYLPSLARYRLEPVTDLMAILYNWGSEKYKGLKQVAKLYGIPNDCPDVDGSKVKDLDLETLKAYQTSDVKLTKTLFDRMNGVYFNL